SEYADKPGEPPAAVLALPGGRLRVGRDRRVGRLWNVAPHPAGYATRYVVWRGRGSTAVGWRRGREGGNCRHREQQYLVHYLRKPANFRIVMGAERGETRR